MKKIIILGALALIAIKPLRSTYDGLTHLGLGIAGVGLVAGAELVKFSSPHDRYNHAIFYARSCGFLATIMAASKVNDLPCFNSPGLVSTPALAALVALEAASMGKVTQVIAERAVGKLSMKSHLFLSSIAGLQAFIGLKTVHLALGELYPHTNSTLAALAGGALYAYGYYKYNPTARQEYIKYQVEKLQEDHLTQIVEKADSLNDRDSIKKAVKDSEYPLDIFNLSLNDYARRLTSCSKELERIEDYPSVERASLLEHKTFLSKNFKNSQVILSKIQEIMD